MWVSPVRHRESLQAGSFARKFAVFMVFLLIVGGAFYFLGYKKTTTPKSPKSGTTQTPGQETNENTITIPATKIGDTISYDMSGYVDISNPDGFWTYTYTSKPTPFTTVTVTAEVTQAHIVIDSSGNPEMSVSASQAQVEDGFSDVHSCIDRATTQQMSFSGTATVVLITKTGSKTTTEDISGSGNAQEHAYTCLNTNQTVKTTRADSYTVALGAGTEEAFQKSGSDSMRAYPKRAEEFSVEALRSDRTFGLGAAGSHTFGTTTLLWSVEGWEDAGSTPCLKVHITMDDDSMAQNGFTSFDLYVWISDSFPMPLKLHLHTNGAQNGNTVVLDYTSTYKSFTPGTTDVPFGTCFANDSESKKRSGVDYKAPDAYGPAMGSNSPSLSGYSLPDAVNFAKSNSDGLRNFLNNNPDAFLLDARYTESGTPSWNLTFGTKQSSKAYNVNVTHSSVAYQNSAAVSLVNRSIKDYSTALTFTGAEQVFQNTPDIENTAYSGGKIDLTKFCFGSAAGIPYPKPDIPIDTTILSPATEYFSYVKALDNSFAASVDSENGQLLFVKTHSGT